MTKAYHDVEAVTRLLEEKEKDLELAAKIGQELLERNRFLDDKVQQLEFQLVSANELITQLRHELTVKTDLLRAYSNDDASSSIDDASPEDIKNVNVEFLQRKVQDLEVENKRLQEEATQLAKEAFDVEEKEEKLVSDAVKHLSEANVQISVLSEEFSHKSDESRKQKEEITHLLAQVCDLQSKSKHLTRENDELKTTVIAYKDTQEELTSELQDFKDKYKEVLELLEDAREEAKRARKKTYYGLGTHTISGMFSSGNEEPAEKKANEEFSLRSEIHSTLKTSFRGTSKHGKSPRVGTVSADPESEKESRNFQSPFAGVFETFRKPHSTAPAIMGLSKPLLKNSDDYHGFESYTVSRDHTASPDIIDLESRRASVDTSKAGVLGGGHPGIGSIPRHGPGILATDSPKRGHPGLGMPPPGSSGYFAVPSETVKVQTVGELKVPSVSAHALSSPLGSIPSQTVNTKGNVMSNTKGHPHLGQLPPFSMAAQEESIGFLNEKPRATTMKTQIEIDYNLRRESMPCQVDGSRPLTRDSGVLSGDFCDMPSYNNRHYLHKPSDDRRSLYNIADGMSDDGLTISEKKSEHTHFAEGISSALEIEKALQNLTPAEVERRRKQLGNSLGYDLGSEGFDSPGSLLGQPGFHFLPYGVRTPDSIMSTGSKYFKDFFDGLGDVSSSSGYYGAGWKLSDKLRIIKPLEGSLTLHHWQRLAVPHLGNFLEEQSGVAVKGGHFKDVIRDISLLSDLEEENLLNDDSFEDSEEEKVILIQDEATKTHQTYTDSKIIHPDEPPSTLLTSTYYCPQMSSGFGELSRPASVLSSTRPSTRMSSRSESICEPNRRTGTLTFSSNIGLARVLNERHIHGRLSTSTMSLNKSVNSLTPSIMSSPTGDKTFSPTGTPLNSPLQTPPGTPSNEKFSAGEQSSFVLSFFSSLKTALYGEQQKEAKHLIKKRNQKKIKQIHKRFGILEKVEEVGVENLFSASPSLLSHHSSQEAVFRESSAEISDDIPSLEDKDELEDIKPGTLTVVRGQSPRPLSADIGATFGQLSAPSFSMFGRPSLNPGDLGKVPVTPAFSMDNKLLPGEGALVGGRGPGRVISAPGEKRPSQLLGAFGVPGTPGTGALKLRPDLGSVPPQAQSPQTESTGFIGSITSMFFGRKGGLL